MNVKSSSFGLALVLGLLALILVTNLPERVAQAQTAGQIWYVDGNCTVCGTGTLGGPFQTINRARLFAGDGDTVLIAQGTYNENLLISSQVTFMGGYTTTFPIWTRDITRYETTIVSDNQLVPGDWNGDWLGSLSVIEDGSTFKMWYSAGNDLNKDSIGYADSPDGVNWFNPLSAPLLEPGPPGAWDQAGVANPTVLATDSGFQMWYVGVDAVGGRAIGYATSPDGLTWQKYDGNPVLRPDLTDVVSFGFPTVIQEGPYDYKMWYSGWRQIWLATSSDGLHWTKYPGTPALTPGPSGAWDDAQVYAPQVIVSSGRYEMWYTAESWATSEPRIGYTWSDDGLNWTKSPDNPVLSGTTDTWEEGRIAHLAVVKQGATNYKTWYQGGLGGEQAFGQAVSSDGITWTKYYGNPVSMGGEPTRWGSSVVAFRDSSGEAVLDGLTITGGAAESGGGIYIAGGLPTIRNCKVTGNVALNSGGGINIVAGAPLIENTIVSGNASVNGWAGGIYVGQASPTISATLVTSNAAGTDGGGLLFWRALQPKLIAVTIANNIASRGGGILLGSGSDLEVYDSRIDSNIAGQMAGLRVDYNSTLAMTNTFIVDNRAIAGGPGALGFSRSSGRLVNVTLANNSASEGPGGIVFYTDRSDDNLVILNGILAFNGTDDLSCSGGTCSVTYSDVQEGSAGNGNISTDPGFVDRATGNYHLRANSPAIDAGASVGAPAADFESDPRPVGAVDMGADEFTFGPIVDVVFLPLILRGF